MWHIKYVLAFFIYFLCFPVESGSHPEESVSVTVQPKTFTLVLDDCSGAIVQYYYDDSCSNLVGISSFASNGETCQIENNQSILHTRLTCKTDTGSSGSNSATDIIGSFSQLLLETPESIR